jgi:SPP1 family predicted phage head-tail adaptor
LTEYPHEIIFQDEKSTPDGAGGRKVDWADAFTTEAFVDPVTSREFYQAQQAQNPIDYNVFIPYQEGIKPTMRIKYGNQILILKSKPIDQGGQGEILVIKCVSL